MADAARPSQPRARGVGLSRRGRRRARQLGAAVALAALAAGAAGYLLKDEPADVVVGAALAAARTRVNEAKIALGERGPVWWSDSTPDQSRRIARNTSYADWYEALGRTA